MRIVDQRNLLDDTKFTSSLFKSKRMEHVKPATVESQFRKLLNQDNCITLELVINKLYFYFNIYILFVLYVCCVNM
jgi:hypothetical protein